MRELNWKGDQVEGMPPGVYDYEKIECSMQGWGLLGEWQKELLKSFTNDDLDIRHSRMGKQEAEALVSID